MFIEVIYYSGLCSSLLFAIYFIAVCPSPVKCRGWLVICFLLSYSLPSCDIIYFRNPSLWPGPKIPGTNSTSIHWHTDHSSQASLEIPPSLIVIKELIAKRNRNLARGPIKEIVHDHLQKFRRHGWIHILLQPRVRKSIADRLGAQQA